MKKKMMMLTLLLMAVMGVQAQSLLGAWKADTETDSDGDKTTMFYIFKTGNKVDMKMLFETEDEDIGKMTFSYTLPGSFTRDGQVLTIKFNPQQSTAKLEEVVFTAEMEKEFKEMPEMKDMLLKMIQEEIDKGMKKQIENEIPFDGDANIKQLTATKLVLGDEDDTLTFTRTK